MLKSYLYLILSKDAFLIIHKDIGPVISFNLRRPDGSWFGHREVEKLASLSGIQLRVIFHFI